MPSQSGPQHRLMEMVAHNPAAAKRVGVPQSVGREFVLADIGRKFGSTTPKVQSFKPRKGRSAK